MKQESKKLDIFEMLKEAAQAEGLALDDQEIETYQEYANRLLKESNVLLDRSLYGSFETNNETPPST